MPPLALGFCGLDALQTRKEETPVQQWTQRKEVQVWGNLEGITPLFSGVVF